MQSLSTAFLIAAALVATLPASAAQERAAAGEKNPPVNVLSSSRTTWTRHWAATVTRW